MVPLHPTKQPSGEVFYHYYLTDVELRLKDAKKPAGFTKIPNVMSPAKDPEGRPGHPKKGQRKDEPTDRRLSVYPCPPPPLAPVRLPSTRL